MSEFVCGDPLLPRVVAVEPQEGYDLLLTFDNGERKIYNAAHLLKLPVYKDLPRLFPLARAEYGTVVWPNDLDIDPDSLYLKSRPA